MELKATISKRGYPCLWESGGGLSNTGKAFLIAGPNGDKKTAMYIRTRGQLACEEHALIPVVIGDIVIKTSHHRLDFEIGVWKILSIENETIQLTKLHTFDDGEWDVEPPEYLEPVISTSKRKASAYHCRSAFWVIPPEKRGV
jgi:hypothetical protein